MKLTPRTSPGADQRIHTRFDKVFPVLVASDLFGEARAVARNISIGGMLVEMAAAPLPLGAVVCIHFQVRREDGTIDEIIARGEVKHHYCLNYATTSGEESARAIGLRFLEFDDRPGLELTWSRWLH